MFIFLDTETTGTGPDDRLCQIAFKTGQGTIVNELFNPGKPIAIEAMAVHHITNEMVKDKPPFRPNSNIAAFSRNKTSEFPNYTGTFI
jgi:DNA polymerase-3 subunit epsilon